MYFFEKAKCSQTVKREGFCAEREFLKSETSLCIIFSVKLGTLLHFKPAISRGMLDDTMVGLGDKTEIVIMK